MECKYCKGNERIVSDGKNVEIIIKSETAVKYYDDGYGWQNEYLKINHCPMCGRELEDGQMSGLIEQVEDWARNKGLDEAESSKQMLKVVEETGEVAAALARSNQDDLRDGIGDVVVTLIILAMQNDLDLYECLNTAYDEIKGRKGKMIDGVFVKESDL